MNTQRKYITMAKAAACALVAGACMQPHQAHAQSGSWTWQSVISQYWLRNSETLPPFFGRMIAGQKGGVSFVNATLDSGGGSEINAFGDTMSVANAPLGVSGVTASITDSYSAGGTLSAKFTDGMGNEIEPTSGVNIYESSTYMTTASAAAGFDVTGGVITKRSTASASAQLNIAAIPGNTSLHLPSGQVKADSPAADPPGGVISSSAHETDFHARGGTYIYNSGALVWGMNVDGAMGQYNYDMVWTLADAQNQWASSHSSEFSGISLLLPVIPTSSVSASDGSGASTTSMEAINIVGVG